MADFSRSSIKPRAYNREQITHGNKDRLSDSYDKELVDEVRRTVQKTRSKINHLKQEVSDKDREIKKERAMRKAAESRDQDKTTEGRGNLPPEKKERTLPSRPEKSKNPYPEEDAEGQEHLTESYYSSDEDMMRRRGSGRRDRRTESDHRSRRDRRRRGSDESWDDRLATYPGRGRHMRGWYPDYPSYGVPPPPPPHAVYNAHNPWISPHRVPPIPMYDPRLLNTVSQEYTNNAFSGQATSTPQQPRRHSTEAPVTSLQYSVPTLVIPTPPKEHGQGDHAQHDKRPSAQAATDTPIQPSSIQQIPVALHFQEQPQAPVTANTLSQTLPPQTPSLADRSIQSHNRTNVSPGAETVTTGVGASPPTIPISHSFDERGLPILLDELGAMKDRNTALSEKCAEAEKEIESLQLQQSVKDAMTDAEIAAKGAALIEEIYAAQKEHDEAIMGRLKLANDERDDALARWQRAQQSKDGFDSGTDVNSNEEDNTPGDSTLNNLLSHLTLAENKGSIDKYGSALVGRISKTKDRRHRITVEEMRAILREKDIAQTKCKKLEREVIELRKNRESSKSRNNNEKSLRAQLDITREERDKALVNTRKLQEELDSLKMYYSLHKSLSQEAHLRDQFNNTLGSIEEQVKARDQVLAKTQLNNSQLASQVRTANDERNHMAAQLQTSQQDNTQLRQKVDQMERLVTVLRKKLAETSVKTV